MGAPQVNIGLEQLMKPILAELYALWGTYGDATAKTLAESRKHLEEVADRMTDDRIRGILDPLLAREQTAPWLGDADPDEVREELDLLALAGFKMKVATSYITLASNGSGLSAKALGLARVDSLCQFLEANHQRVSEALTQAQSLKLFRRRSRIRLVRAGAQRGVFCISCIVVDGLSEHHFPRSYSYATAAPGEEAA